MPTALLLAPLGFSDLLTALPTVQIENPIWGQDKSSVILVVAWYTRASQGRSKPAAAPVAAAVWAVAAALLPGWLLSWKGVEWWNLFLAFDCRITSNCDFWHPTEPPLLSTSWKPFSTHLHSIYVRTVRYWLLFSCGSFELFLAALGPKLNCCSAQTGHKLV